jgi:hypothetical protein
MAKNARAFESNDKPDIATQIMSAMVRMPPEPHKDAPKPKTRKGEAQRRRREKERLAPRSP